MKRKSESPQPQRTIDAAAKAAFLAALCAGLRREDAAAEAGFSLTGFYGARARDLAFAAGWAEALATPSAAKRRARAYEQRGEVRIAPANRRQLQRRRAYARFTGERQAVFLAHLARSADSKAAAGAAGVCESTVRRHRGLHEGFRGLHREALAEAYDWLEREALRLALAAQRRLRAALENAHNPPLHLQGRGTAAGGGGATSCPAATVTACPTCGHAPDEEAILDRALRLLARRDRKPRGPETRFKPGGRRQQWTFGRALREVDRITRNIGGDDLEPLPPGDGEEDT